MKYDAIGRNITSTDFGGVIDPADIDTLLAELYANGYVADEDYPGVVQETFIDLGDADQMIFSAQFEDQRQAIYDILYDQRVDFYKENVAFVNNLFAGTENSAILKYMRYRGSGAPQSKLHFKNFLIEHNTLYKTSEDGLIRMVLYIELGNDNLEDIFVKNNIIGKYNTGDWDFDNDGNFTTDDLGVSNYNLFYPSLTGGGALNSNSIEADPLFVDADILGSDSYDDLQTALDFNLKDGSPAINRADSSSGIFYDINWNFRDGSPDIGAFEYVG